MVQHGWWHFHRAEEGTEIPEIGSAVEVRSLPRTRELSLCAVAGDAPRHSFALVIGNIMCFSTLVCVLWPRWKHPH